MAYSPATQEVWGWRPKIEQFHRESRRVICVAKCLAQKVRIVCNHIGCGISVWARLKRVAYQTRRTIYQVRYNPFTEFVFRELRSPSSRMELAYVQALITRRVRHRGRVGRRGCI